jgi:chemotaxis protein methyltransferase CheR
MSYTQPRSISERAFRDIQTLFARESGIRLSFAKQSLVASRLHSRVQQLGLPDYESYFELITGEPGGHEKTLLIDLLTTHETYFFREPKHFEHLAQSVIPALRGKPIRVWCAAASTGEEAYSAAMTLAATHHSGSWEVLGTDISERSLLTAERGLYRIERLQHMPDAALKQFCLRGKDDFAGAMLIASRLRERMEFVRHNLLDVPRFGQFDVIFLRNVLIYFEQDMRQRIVANALEALKAGGWLYTGHADSLQGLTLPLETFAPSLHRKVPLASDQGASSHTGGRDRAIEF